MIMERESFTIMVEVIAPFLFWKKKNTIKVSYRQCNIKELFSFIEDIERWREIAERVVEFIEKHADKKLSGNQLSSIYIQSWAVFNILYDTYFKECFKGSKNKQTTVKKTDLWPMQANIAFIAKETCTSILDLYEKCTIQDIEYLMEGVIRNLNSQTKEWQKRNRMRILQRKAERRSPEEEKAIKERLSKIPD